MIESRFVYPLFYYGFLDGEYGTQVSICCPFHDESKPSLLIDLEDEKFHCFGCGEHGSLTEFFMKLENKDFFETTKMIIQLNKDKPRASSKFKKIEKMSNKEALTRAYRYYRSFNEIDWEDEESQAAEYMDERGYDRSLLTQLGVKIVPCDVYGVLIPFYDNGRFRGYAKRALVKDAEPKYRYNKGFIRQNTIVGDYYKDWVFITEGSLDWLKLRQFNQNNSGAILGWKISDAQISKLQKVTSKIVSCLDATPSGEQGTEYLRQYFDVVRFQFPNDVKDIGDMNENQFARSLLLTKRQITQYGKKRK